jgi:hypothetical protein
MSIDFIENKNKIDIEIEIIMEDIIDSVYDNIVDYYKTNKINDIILINKKLDPIRNKLINMNFLTNNNQLKENYMVYAISKNVEYTKKGIIDRIEEKSIILKKRQKSRLFRILNDDYYVFYKEKKTIEEEKNDQLKNLLKNILNNKIKIKKIKK